MYVYTLQGLCLLTVASLITNIVRFVNGSSTAAPDVSDSGVDDGTYVQRPCGEGGAGREFITLNHRRSHIGRRKVFYPINKRTLYVV